MVGQKFFHYVLWKSLNELLANPIFSKIGEVGAYDCQKIVVNEKMKLKISVFLVYKCFKIIFKKKHTDTPSWLSGKESVCNTEDPGSIPGSERPCGEGNGNPFQCSCLENPRNRGAWWAARSKFEFCFLKLNSMGSMGSHRVRYNRSDLAAAAEAKTDLSSFCLNLK